jgi:hypothetical protein
MLQIEDKNTTEKIKLAIGTSIKYDRWTICKKKSMWIKRNILPMSILGDVQKKNHDNRLA